MQLAIAGANGAKRSKSPQLGLRTPISLFSGIICRCIYSPGIVRGPRGECLKFRWARSAQKDRRAPPSEFMRCEMRSARGRLVSRQRTAVPGKETSGWRCGLNPGHNTCSANLLVISLARTWGCAHVRRYTYAFHLLLCGSRHSSCFSCVGSVIYSGSCIVQCCLQ